MMWGAIHYAVKLSCRDEVLIPHTLPAMNLHRDVFQHDNDRPHTARATVLILAKQNVTVLLWPFKSLDLNTKEHFVDDLDRRVRVVNQRRKLCKNCSRLLSKNGWGSSARPYSSIDRVYAEN
jgi:hypothetical protein